MANDFEKLVQAYVDRAQDLNDAATDLLVKVSLDGSSGVQLDGIGSIIGLERNGLDDDAYRAALKGWVLVNTAGGTIPQLVEIIRLVTSTTDQRIFVLTESYPAGFVIEYTEILPSEVGPMAAEAMYQAKAAGVHGIFQYHDTEPVFAFDGFGGSQMGNILPGDSGYYLRTAIRNRGARESEIL